MLPELLTLAADVPGARDAVQRERAAAMRH
jgi:hypothetical protein